MKNKTVIPVVVATDMNYIAPTIVTICSLLDNRNKEYKYNIYVFHTDLGEKDIGRLETICYEDAEVKCVDISTYVDSIINLGYGYLTKETLYRLYISEILSQYEKVVYIDVDTLVLGDISDLYNVDMGDNILAAAINGPTKDTVGMYAVYMDALCTETFNAGVLLINTKEFINAGIKDKCVKLLLEDNLRTDRWYTCMDQDVLNITCVERTKKIDVKWNMHAQYISSGFTQIFPRYRQMFFEANNDVRIVHYTGERKPWKCPGVPYGDKYWECAKKYGVYDELMPIRDEYLQKLSDDFYLSSIPKGKKIALYGAGNFGTLVHNMILDTQYAEVVIWVDKKHGGGVKPIEEILNIDYDYIVISVQKPKIAYEIYRDLREKYDVQPEKIKWLFEKNAPWK